MCHSNEEAVSKPWILSHVENRDTDRHGPATNTSHSYRSNLQRSSPWVFCRAFRSLELSAKACVSSPGLGAHDQDGLPRSAQTVCWKKAASSIGGASLCPYLSRARKPNDSNIVQKIYHSIQQLALDKAIGMESHIPPNANLTEN